MRIYDISRTLSETVAVWPDDIPFSVHWSARIDRGSSVNVGSFVTSTHAGTHVDAPLHFKPNGASVDKIGLEIFVGPAFVVEVVEDAAVDVRHVASLDFAGVPRVLFKTRSSQVDDDVFDSGFIHIEPALIRHLSNRGVVLVGTDAPSVDPFDSTDLPAHHELARAGMANLENLCLRDVPSGLYHLTALPLKLAGLDAAPVRAILMPAAPRDMPGASH